MMEIEDYQQILFSDVKIELEETPELDETAIEDEESFPEKYHEIYGAYKQKDYEACLVHIDEVTENHIEYQILKSACLIHSGKKVSEAHKILDDVLKKEPDNAYTLYAKGLAFYHEDKWDESIPYFEKAVEMDSSGDMDRAELMIEKATEKIKSRDELKKKFNKHRASVLRYKKSPPKPSAGRRIVRRFGCEICNHFFGKKYNLDRHNRSLHKRNTPLNFPTSPKSIKGQKVNVKLQDEPEAPNEEEGDVEMSSESQDDAESDESVVSAKSEPSRPAKVVALKKGKVRCPVCRKQFKRSSIARHVIIHSGNKQHKCTECPMAFHQKSDLVRHIAIHSDELQFECDQCDRRFRIKKNLQVHKRRHHSA